MHAVCRSRVSQLRPTTMSPTLETSTLLRPSREEAASRGGGFKRRNAPPYKQHLYSKALLGTNRRYHTTLTTMDESPMRAMKRLGEMPAELSDLKRPGILVQSDSRDLLSKYKGNLVTVQRVEHKQENARKRPTWFLFPRHSSRGERSENQGGPRRWSGPRVLEHFPCQGRPRHPARLAGRDGNDGGR